MLFGMKLMLVCFNLHRNGTGNGLSNIDDTFAESFQVQILALHQSLCVFKAGLSSLSDGWSKYKQKVPDTPNSSLQNLKTFSLKGYRNTSQKWIMYAANIAILELRFFSERYYFRLWVFASTGEYFYCWHWRVTIT